MRVSLKLSNGLLCSHLGSFRLISLFSAEICEFQSKCLTLVQAAYGFRGMGGGGHIVPADLYMRYRGPNKWFIGFLKF